MRPVRANAADFSLRRRLVWQFVVLSAVLILALFFAVRFTAERASRASQDAVLSAALVAISDGLRGVDGGVELDLPYAAFSMLGAMGDERVFYSLMSDGRHLTGYAGIPAPPVQPRELTPVFWDADYRGNKLRLAAISRQLLLDTKIEKITVILGQTRYGQAAIAQNIANSAIWTGAAFLLLAIPMALLAARTVLRPVNLLADAVARRGPDDLRPVRHPAPRELLPLVRALNGFISRLRAALSLAETFIFEAAHRIRTPLTLVRTEAEIALAETTDEATRLRLRRMVRAIGESSRSANQILDHAMVMYRSGQFTTKKISFAGLVTAVLRSIRPLAEMREVDLVTAGLDQNCMVAGDERMLEAALRNIIDNALKYSPSDAVVTIRLTCTDSMAVLSVLDEGRGLGDDITELTTRFRRGSNAGDVVGSGLGLTIVNEVAIAHGGRFDLQRRIPCGTSAVISLPLYSHKAAPVTAW